MDKKNTTLGVLLLVAAFGAMYFNARRAPMAPPAREIGGANAPAPSAPASQTSDAGTAAPAGTAPGATATAPTTAADGTALALAKDDPTAQITTLSNDFIEVHFTNLGGAIRDIAFKKYDAKKSVPGVPFVFNQVHSDPVLAFVNAPGLDRGTTYTLEPQRSPNEVVYTVLYQGQIEIRRRYTIVTADDKTGDPYQLRLETTFTNQKANPISLPAIALSLGTQVPESVKDYGIYLVNGHNVGGDVSFTARSQLQGGGFLSLFGIGNRGPVLSIDTSGPVLWGSVNSQFFTGILTPAKPAQGISTQRVALPPFAGSTLPAYGITASAQFATIALAPNGTAKLETDYYAGPKEYNRLSNTDVFKLDQHKVLNFGMFKWFSQILLTLMSWMHDWTGNWGLAIILSTLSLKIVFLYPTLSASKSAKRMQKLQPELQAIKEKYKDNPQKMQVETMEIFKRNRVNPVGGCVPLVITMPFFMGFYRMLQTTADLRFAEFLWAKDLSAPDTVAIIPILGGLPLNIMPLLMGTTMIIQMRLVPQPTVDNAQAKMMKFFPWMIIIFCYSFSCALSLYSTINGLFTIAQQLVINRMKDDPPLPAAAGGKGLKNVTPKRKN